MGPTRTPTCPACGQPVSARRRRCRACGWQEGDEVLELEDPGVGPGTGTEVVLGADRRFGRREALVGAGVLVGVTAAVLVLGRGGGGASTAATSTTASSSTTAASTTTTSRPRRTTTTSAPSPLAFGNRPDLVVPGVAPGTALYALTSGGQVVRVDLGTGSFVRRQLRQQTGQGVGLLPRAGGAVLTNGARLWFVPDAVSARPRELGVVTEISFLHPDPDPSAFWVGRWSERQGVTRVHLDGTAEPEVALPALTYPAGVVDPSGLLLLQSQTGGSYAFDPASGASLQVSAGRVLARAGGLVVEEVCDALLQCRRQARDVASGQTVVLQDVSSGAGWWGYAVSSPDGRRVAVTEYEAEPGGGSLRVYRTADGAQELESSGGGLGSAFNLPPFGWSADSRHLFFTLASAVRWWDATTGASGQLDLDLPGSDTFLFQLAVGVS